MSHCTVATISQQNYVVVFKITRVLNVLPETIYEGRRG